MRVFNKLNIEDLASRRHHIALDAPQAQGSCLIMGPCCVEGCEGTSEDTYYFEFPTSRILRRKWLELIPIPGKLPLGTVVCSRHFHQDDYESVRGKVRLKRKVVPSLYLEQRPTTPSQIPLPPSPQPLTTSPSPKSPKSPASPTSPRSPPKDPCDSTTVSVPSPIDAEKMIDIDIQRRIAGSVTTMLKTQNGVSEDRSVGKSTLATPAAVPPLEHKEDIEDMITNYHIINKVPNAALLADLLPPARGARLPPTLAGVGLVPHGHTVPVEFDNDEPIEIEDKEAAPVFIEVSVDKDTSAAGAGSQDCLMLLESVQVEVDPSTLMLTHDEEYYREEETKANKKDDPISLLTSSDDDDVILQEPHIDTVEVSDETDEDDMPLVKLVKKTPDTSKKKQKKKSKVKKRPDIEKIMWGMYDFYCVQCHFSTENSAEYNKHVSEHSKVLHVCPICSYTSSSKSMFARHTRIHKVEKKFKCHLCDYRARHKMSLIYHLKKHDNGNVSNKDFKCKRCGFYSSDKTEVLEHLSSCRKVVSEKKHVCASCDYATKKKSDLKRHISRLHPDMFEEPDPDYV
ncbi:hypothetical protein PYW08_012473 [Mythimna loreyi]|uniref:Uncharacterized protein n=1 Tax=Mythimna loreyi TaxID=667449 RepID=A0ACC2Q145_9NEOP|nr:hypothetical protein PYW08_012473 [Mythimna loreyi]